MSPKFLCCMFLLGFLHMPELDAFEYINCVKLKGRHTSINSFRKEKKKKDEKWFTGSFYRLQCLPAFLTSYPY